MIRSTLFFIAATFSLGSCLAQTTENKEEAEKDFQFTFISPLGTNGMASYKTVNRLSFNLFAGVSKGVDGAELGGFANVVLKDVKGAQLAGFVNVVLGKVRGAQFAGFVNYGGGSFYGAAFAGFCNVHLDSLKGAQFAGFCNYNQKEATGLQGAGFINVSLKKHTGAQLAGFANITGGDIDGIQAAGFFNYAKKVKGVQLGFVNVADTVDGASIGFLNINKKGLHQVEVSADEIFYSNLSFRTGSQQFYNIFSAGASQKGGNFLWNFGYGVGTSFRLSSKLRSDVSLSAYHVSSGLFYNGTSELYKIYVGVEYKVANKFFIAAGPTFNLYWADALLSDYQSKYAGIAPYSVFNLTNSNTFNFKGWVGGKVAIRFL